MEFLKLLRNFWFMKKICGVWRQLFVLSFIFTLHNIAVDIVQLSPLSISKCCYPLQCKHSPTYAVVTPWKVWRKSNFAQCRIEYAYHPVHIHVCTSESCWNANSNACVIAQQYSSTTFVSLCFHSLKEKFDASFKNDDV
jgi:hypothetical protein